MLDISKVFEAISISLHVSFVSTLSAFLLSIFFGYLIATKKFILKKYIVSVLGSLTSIPPVCAGLIVYLIISRSGPLGWMELLYTPSAMIIAQFIIIFPIMVTLIINCIEREYPQLKDELISYGASQKDILFLLISCSILRATILAFSFLAGSAKTLNEDFSKISFTSTNFKGFLKSGLSEP